MTIRAFDSLDQAVADLFARRGRAAGGWSLEPTRAMLAHVGNPHDTFPCIHVGGTNGKGSVATLIAGALTASGRRVGLYTSPHLVHVRERMVVGGSPISDDAFVAWANRLMPVVEQTGASFFEVTTVIAFADFAARNVDIAVIEVGLGGRLDATNVITPLVSVVTNVSLEHQDYLGDTIERIAREKAGIAKPHVPFIVGEQDPHVVDVLVSTATQAGAETVVVPPQARYDGPLGLSGPHQARNAAIAEAALRALTTAFTPEPAAIRDGFARAWLPGRFDARGRWIFDVAHNPAGVRTLVSAIEAAGVERPLHVIFGALGDKDGGAMVSALIGVADRLWVTIPPDAPPDRVPNVSEWVRGHPEIPVEPAFEAVLDAAEQGAGTILVTGSFYTVGAALARLPGFAPFG